MKSLLLKDVLLVCSQKKTVILILTLELIFSVCIGEYSFAVWYMVLLFVLISLSTLSYDEYENGNAFLFTMPFTRKQYVTEKYFFSFLAVLAGIIVGCIFGFLGARLRNDGMYVEEIIASAIGMIFISMLIPMIVIPLRLRFGSEQGRIISGIIFGGLTALVIIMRQFFPEYLEEELATVNGRKILAFALFLFLAALCFSWRISLSVIRKKEF